MISKLASNSVALLGGRRIGKTSLMRHAEKRLRDAGFATYFADCQTVRDWSDFAAMVTRTWDVRVDAPFTPSKLFQLVETLIGPRPSMTVFLLDEIDQLLEWDTVHPENEVTEAFFRACRTISQEQVAQFVFSGERTIARRLWDPHSPHWNFCHSIMLRWLDPEAARQLILTPLKSMQIEVDDEESFASVAWSRTNGHPRLLQLLGDSLIRQINEREPTLRATVEPSDLTDVADTYSYAEQYLETYWGQATVFERLITLVVAIGNEGLGQQKQFLVSKHVPFTDEKIRAALRILELYGIIGPTASGYKLLLEWLLEAIEFYGGIDDLLGLYLKDCHE
jgi:predicted transcriptional regulator